MATEWRGQITQVVLARTESRRRVYRVHLTYEIFDDQDPGTVLAVVPMQIAYPAVVFRGLTRPQALALIRDTGVGEIPSLKLVGANLVDDYDDGEVLRSLPANYPFTP